MSSPLRPPEVIDSLEVLIYQKDILELSDRTVQALEQAMAMYRLYGMIVHRTGQRLQSEESKEE